MNMATASGRNLFPDNIARELFPSFSLPLWHLLMEKLIPEMVLEEVKKKNKEYIGREEGILQQTTKFNYAKLSSSIGNFRSGQHEKFNGIHWHCGIYRLYWLFWIHLKKLIQICLTVCSCHVTYAFQSESTLYIGNYRVWIHCETHTWHDKNIQSNAHNRQVFRTYLNHW